MRVGDIVELLDESVYEGKWAGRMTVISIFVPDIGDYVKCIHPEMGISDFEVDDLVVMEDTDDSQ